MSNLHYVFYHKSLIIFQKFSKDEFIDVSTCNLLETIHDIWVQQSKNKLLFVCFNLQWLHMNIPVEHVV